MNVVLDLHDFTVSYNRLDILLKLKEYFPNFKVSLFTIPDEGKMDFGPTLNKKENLKEIKKHLDWMQIIPHGFKHNGLEMTQMDTSYFRDVILPKMEQMFKDDGLPYEKGFCAPHWKWSDGVASALDEKGWWGAVLREDRMTKTKRFYRYTHLLNEPFWESDLPVLKLHGHVYGTKNDIGLCFDNLLRLPRETQFYYVTDYLE